MALKGTDAKLLLQIIKRFLVNRRNIKEQYKTFDDILS
jgi:hypothetical protein